MCVTSSQVQIHPSGLEEYSQHLRKENDDGIGDKPVKIVNERGGKAEGVG